MRLPRSVDAAVWRAAGGCVHSRWLCAAEGNGEQVAALGGGQRAQQHFAPVAARRCNLPRSTAARHAPGFCVVPAS